MFGIQNFGSAIGDEVSDDISNLTQPQNSEQSWQTAAMGGGLAGRPKIEDYSTPSQRSSLIRAQNGLPPIGAPPGSDIRSAADRSGPGFTGGVTLGGKMDSEADWRSVFGAKKTPGQVAGLPSLPGNPSTDKPLGMASVMAGHQYAANLLHSFANGTF